MSDEPDTPDPGGMDPAFIATPEKVAAREALVRALRRAVTLGIQVRVHEDEDHRSYCVEDLADMTQEPDGKYWILHRGVHPDGSPSEHTFQVMSVDEDEPYDEDQR